MVSRSDIRWVDGADHIQQGKAGRYQFSPMEIEAIIAQRGRYRDYCECHPVT